MKVYDTSMGAIKKRIKDRRIELGLSYGELSKMTSISKASLHRYENGDAKNIAASKLPILATALLTTPEYLMGWDIEKPANTNVRELKYKLFETIKKLPEDDLARILDYAETFKALQRARSKKQSNALD